MSVLQVGYHKTKGIKTMIDFSKEASAIVLGGGSIKGAFQVGALPVIAKHFTPNLMVGTSVGALNAAFIVSKMGQGYSFGACAAELEYFWRHEIEGFSSIASMRSWLSLLARGALGRWQGLVSMDKLEKLVRREIKVENLIKSPVKLLVTAVDINSGRLKVFDNYSDEIVDAIIASTAIPIEMPYKVIGDNVFVDGGLRQVLPIEAALNANAKNIIAISTYPDEFGTIRKTNVGSVLELLERTVEILISQQHEQSLPRLKAMTDFTHIRPPQFLDQQFNFNFFNFNSWHISEMIDLGEIMAEIEFNGGAG